METTELKNGNTPYFCLSQQFAIRTQPPSLRSSQRLAKVTVNIVAQSSRHDDITKHVSQYTAMSCSNDVLVIQRSGSADTSPVLRSLTWFAEHKERVIAMDYSPDAEWLLCASSNKNLFLVPAHALFTAQTQSITTTHVNPTAMVTRTKIHRTRPQGHSLGRSKINNMDFVHPPPSLAAMVAEATAQAEENKSNQTLTSIGTPNSSIGPPSLQSQRSNVSVASSIGSVHSRRATEDESFFDVLTNTTAPPRLADTTRISALRVNGLQEASAVSSCVWWRLFSGENYAIVSTYEGDLLFINLLTHQETRLHLGTPIMKLEFLTCDDPAPLSRGPVGSSKNSSAASGEAKDQFPFLFQSTEDVPRYSGLSDFLSASPHRDSSLDRRESSSTEGGGSSFGGNGSNASSSQHKTQWRALLIHTMNSLGFVMVLEHRVDERRTVKRGNGQPNVTSFSSSFPSFVSSPSDPKWRPIPVQRFPKNHLVSAQYLSGHPCVSVFNQQDSTVELYELHSLVNGAPFMRFYTHPGSTMHHCTSDFIFSLGRVRDVTQIHIISVKALRLSVLHKSTEDAIVDARKFTVQTLSFPKVFGVLPLSHDMGFLLWTMEEVFRCHWNAQLQQYIRTLSNSIDSSVYDQVLQHIPAHIDVTPFYEIAAQAEFDAGHYLRSFTLFKSFVTERPSLEAIVAFTEQGCWWYALELLRCVTGNEHVFISLNHDERTRYCDLMVTCFISVEIQCQEIKAGRIIVKRDKDPSRKLIGFSCKEEEFRVFLETNRYYTTTHALSQLLTRIAFPFAINYALRCAHVRKAMPECLMRIARDGLHLVSAVEVGFLFNRGYAPLLLQTEIGGHVFRTLPAWQQLEVVLLEMVPVASVSPTEPTTVNVPLMQAQITSIRGLVPQLDAKRLVQLLKFIDPGIFHRGIIWAQDQRACKQAVVELFLIAVVKLLYLQTLHTTPVPASDDECPLLVQGYDAKRRTDVTRKALRKSNGEEVYTQDVLEMALLKFWGTYRVSEIIVICKNWQNWEAVGVLFERAGRISDAFETQLLLAGHKLEQWRASNVVREVHDGKLSQNMLLLIENERAMTAIKSPVEKARLVTMMLRFWKLFFPLHFNVLEESLIRGVAYLYDALAIVLFNTSASKDEKEAVDKSFVSSHATLDSDNETQAAVASSPSQFKAHWPHLSVSVYLAVSREKLQQVTARPSITTLGKLTDIGRGGMMSGRLFQNSESSINRLWCEIVSNLDKELDANKSVIFSRRSRLPLTVTTTPGVNTEDIAAREKEKKMAEQLYANKLMAFTCGHAYDAAYFHTQLVPELMARLATLQPALPETAKLLNALYSRKHVPLACPPCVMSYLLQEQNRLHRTIQQKQGSSAHYSHTHGRLSK